MTFYDAYMEPQDTSSRVKKHEMVSAWRVSYPNSGNNPPIEVT